MSTQQVLRHETSKISEAVFAPSKEVRRSSKGYLFDLSAKKRENSATVVVVDKLFKQAHFFLGKSSQLVAKDVAESFYRENLNIVGFHDKSSLTEIHVSRVISGRR